MSCPWPGDTLWGIILVFPHVGTGFLCVLALKGCVSSWVSWFRNCWHSLSHQLSTKLEGTAASGSPKLCVRVGNGCLDQVGGGQQSSKFRLPPALTLPARAPRQPQHLTLSEYNFSLQQGAGGQPPAKGMSDVLMSLPGFMHSRPLSCLPLCLSPL